MGKASKKLRHCPAVRHEINSAECGENRNGNYSCPVDCEYNPLGLKNFDAYWKIEHRLIDKCIEHTGKRLNESVIGGIYERMATDDMDQAQGVTARQIIENLAQLSENELEKILPSLPPDLLEMISSDPEALQELLELEEAERDEQVDMYSIVCSTFYALLRHKDMQGKTLYQKWSEENWTDLNNDERSLMRHWQTLRPALIEVQRIRGEYIDCIDVLSPDRRAFVLWDKKLNSQVVRFDKLISFVVHYPHFSRLFIKGEMLPHEIENDWLRVLRQQGLEHNFSEQDWLFENYGDLFKLVRRLKNKHSELSIRQSDATFTTSRYRIKSTPMKVGDVLATYQNVIFVPKEDRAKNLPKGLLHQFEWYETQQIDGTQPQHLRTLLANINIFKKHVELETHTLANYEKVKDAFEQLTSQHLEFEKIHRVNRAEQIANQQAEQAKQKGEDLPDDIISEPSQFSFVVQQYEIPEELRHGSEGLSQEELNQEIMKAWIPNNLMATLNSPLPLFDNQLPTSVAQNPQMKPHLITWAKNQIRTCERAVKDQQLDLTMDYTHFLTALGLDELV